MPKPIRLPLVQAFKPRAPKVAPLAKPVRRAPVLVSSASSAPRVARAVPSGGGVTRSSRRVAVDPPRASVPPVRRSLPEVAAPVRSFEPRPAGSSLTRSEGPTCKPRPTSSKGRGESRAFVPWCERRR